MASTEIINLEHIPEIDEAQIISEFSFNPETKRATLKLNGIYNVLPAFIFPIAFDKYDHSKLEDTCIENVQTELDKYKELRTLDKAAILAILNDDENKSRMLESIKDYHIGKLQEEQQEEQPIEYESVSATLRRHEGIVRTKGTITGISRISKAISKVLFYCNYCKRLVEIDFPLPVLNKKDIEKKCDKCGKFSKDSLNPEHRNVVMIELEDTDTFNEMDRLSVYLFDEDTKNILVNETVIIKGQVQVISDLKRMYTCLYSESIKYVNRDNFTLSVEDIEKIKEFARVHGIYTIDKLVERFDHSIVGYDHVKKGLLLIGANTSDKIENSEHLDGLLIGPPGVAKTELLERITEIVPGSSFESAENSSGKSLTAIIEKSDNNTLLRLGAIPLARGGICGLDEVGRMNFDDQGHLLGVMQKRFFTINKHGIRARIGSPTSIVASANPINTDWRDSDKIDLNEFPLLKQKIDRYDLIFIFKKRKSKKENDEFIDKLSEVQGKKEKGELIDYTEFLVKYLQYAKQFNPILTDEARIMIREFYKEVSLKDFRSDRLLPTMHNLVKAFARLKLKDVADEEDAKDAMEFYNVMLSDFQKNVVISQSPKDIAYQECVSCLKDSKDRGGIALEELIKTICKRNKQVAIWLGCDENKSLKMRDNHKITDLYHRILNHSNIKQVQEKPAVLQWLCDSCDVCDEDLEDKRKNNNNSKTENTEDLETKNNSSTSELRSHTSHESHTISEETDPILEEKATEDTAFRFSDKPKSPIYHGPDLLRKIVERKEGEF